MRFTFTRVGVLLAGCGTHDGTDVGEAVLTFLELERQGVRPVALVPPGNQMHVVDHSSGNEAEGESRDMAAEAARITRGKVELLGESPLERLHALIIPGGGGATKNLMSGFLQRDVRRELQPAVAGLIDGCLSDRRPIGMISVANFLLNGRVDSPVLPERAGSEPEPLIVDPERRLVYTPGFLSSASLAHVAEGIAALVEMVLHFAAETRDQQAGPA